MKLLKKYWFIVPILVIVIACLITFLPCNTAPLASDQQMERVIATKTASAGGSITAHPGGRITYTLSITNNNNKAISVDVTDTLPEDTVLISGCDAVTNTTLAWNIPCIRAKKTHTITYTVSPDYTVDQVLASENDIILKNTDAKVMNKTIAAPEKDIWVLGTFNNTDIRRMSMGIDALITANVDVPCSNTQKFNNMNLVNHMYLVAFSGNANLPTNDKDTILASVFSTTTNSITDQLRYRIVPGLYGGTNVPASDDVLYRGERATAVTMKDLITGDMIFTNKNGVTTMYIVDNTKLVEVGDTVVPSIDPSTVLPSLTDSERYVVLRPSIELGTLYSLEDDEYYNDHDKEEYTELEKALIATAETYLLRGDRLQYESLLMSKSEYCREMLVKNPEDYTVDQYGYLDCSGFTYDLHWATYGYAAKATDATGDTLTYNKCQAMLACIANGWNPETLSGSNESAIFYYTTTFEETEAEKEAIYKEFVSRIRPGDIVVYEYGAGGGHAMAYVGNGLLIHSTGSGFPDGKSYDSHEATIRYQNLDILFDPTLAGRRYMFEKPCFGIVRPQNLTTPKITENTAKRISGMQGIVGEKVASTAMGQTVSCGDTITYTFYVFNTNPTEKKVTIKDTLSPHVKFVSSTGGTHIGRNIKWNLTVPADTRIEVSYTVQVKKKVPAYTAIDGSKATINGVSHKCIDAYVANTLSDEQQQALIQAVNTVKAMDTTNMDVIQAANQIYKTAFGVDNIFGDQITSYDLLVGNIDRQSDKQNVGIFNESKKRSSDVSLMDSNPSPAARMVAPGMYGGNRVYSSAVEGETYTRYLNVGDQTLRSRYFWEKDLVIGDIYLLKGNSTEYLYIYVGNNTLVNLEDMQNCDAREQLQRARYLKTWNYYAVLRPSIVLDIN